MSSIKLKFRTSSSEVKEGVIYYQIIHDRCIRQIHTDYRIYDNEWHSENSSVQSCAIDRREYIREISERIESDLQRLRQITALLERRNTKYTSDDIVRIFKNNEYGITLFSFMNKLISQLHQSNRFRTSETYTSALNSFSAFRHNEDMFFDDINSEVILRYESYLKSKGLMRNTTSFYMRILRAVYNRAVAQGLVEQRYPFKHAYTGVDKTQKRAITLVEIKRIKALKLDRGTLDFARDMFLFSFYTRGMSFVDMAYLTPKNITHGMLVYLRRKTGRQMVIKWEDCMQHIVDKYKNETEGFLLPIIKLSHGNQRKQYKSTLLYIDRNLKKIGLLAQVNSILTLYVARHSWASIAHNINIPLGVISEALGHESEETTNIYLSSLDNCLIDKANARIIKSVQ